MSTSAFNSSSKTVGELLGNVSRDRVEVPEFQRGYEWNKKHVTSFWEDIVQFEKERGMANGPKKYFLGPIVVLHGDDEIMQLLDGQQRLATATILLSVLREVAKATGVKDGDDFARDTQNQFIAKADGEYALKLGATDKAFFRDFIQSETPVKSKPSLRTHRNIFAARHLLLEKVKNKTTGATAAAQLSILRSLRQILVSDLVLACIPVESERDAFRIFETLNDRGLRLATPDLLLNYLMRQATPEKDQKKVREYWTDMIERMGKRDINRFLRHMWVSNYGDLKAQDLFSELKTHIEKKGISSLDFARTCKDECEYYVQLISIEAEHLGKSTTYVKSILTGLDAQVSLPALLSAYQKLPPEEFVKVCQLILVFVVRYSVIAGLDASGLENVLFGLARDIRVQMAQEDGNKANSKACMKHIKDTLIRNSPSDKQLETAIPQLVLSPDEAPYVMSRIANHMQTTTKETRISDANVEHIFPKNPDEKEWGGTSNHELMEPYLWHIGNLTVMGTRLNGGVGNKEYNIKRVSYENASELEITKKIAADYDDWNVRNIEDRAAKLTKPMLEVWGFENPSRV